MGNQSAIGGVMKPAGVGIVQMDTEDRKERNLKKASALIEEAVAKGAEIVGFRSYSVWEVVSGIKNCIYATSRYKLIFERTPPPPHLSPDQRRIGSFDREWQVSVNKWLPPFVDTCIFGAID